MRVTSMKWFEVNKLCKRFKHDSGYGPERFINDLQKHYHDINTFMCLDNYDQHIDWSNMTKVKLIMVNRESIIHEIIF